MAGKEVGVRGRDPGLKAEKNLVSSVFRNSENYFCFLLITTESNTFSISPNAVSDFNGSV